MSQFVHGILEISLLAVHIFTKTYHSRPWKSAAGRKILFSFPTKTFGNPPCNWNPPSLHRKLLIPYHMQKTNLITQLVFEIKLIHYLPSLWACPSMPDDTNLKQPTKICCFHGLLVTSKKSTLYLFKLFERYSSLKNPPFWLALRFSDHNSWTKFFPNMLFLKKVKRPLTLLCWSKKAYIFQRVRLLLKS